MTLPTGFPLSTASWGCGDVVQRACFGDMMSEKPGCQLSLQRRRSARATSGDISYDDEEPRRGAGEDHAERTRMRFPACWSRRSRKVRPRYDAWQHLEFVAAFHLYGLGRRRPVGVPLSGRRHLPFCS